MSFLPMWWNDPPTDTFGGLITPDGKLFRKNQMKNHTETNARLRMNGGLDGWATYSAKWVGQGGAIVSWLVRGQSRELDLTDDRKKRLILTYNYPLLTNRIYRALKEIIESVDDYVKDDRSMFYTLAQATNIEVKGIKTVSVVTDTRRNPSSAILHLRNRISGRGNIVDKKDTVYTIFKKDGLNA